MKQTALQWFLERQYDLEMAYNQGIIKTNTYIKGKREAVEQAKEMEEEQIIDAYNESFRLRDKPYSTAIKYYKETYGGNK